MLKSVTAIRFDGRVQSGRTAPCRLTCSHANGVKAEVVAKFSAGCDRKVIALAVEAIAAMLAADLDLPVPEPFLVTLEADFIESVRDETVLKAMRASNPVAFGSKHLPSGFVTWPPGKTIPRDALSTAIEIFAFDALIANDDRRPPNPNCLFNGSSLAIFDHEMAFLTEGIIGWKPPWTPGGLETLRQSARHIFVDQLRGRPLDLDRFEGAWMTITDNRLEEYWDALPVTWAEAEKEAEKVTNVRRNGQG